MTLEKKLEKWNKKKSRHRYLIMAKLNIESVGLLEYNYIDKQKIFDAYNKKHALMQFYMYCIENHYTISGDNDWGLVKDKLVVRKLV